MSFAFAAGASMVQQLNVTTMQVHVIHAVLVQWHQNTCEQGILL